MVNYRTVLWEVAAVCAILTYAASAPAAKSNEDHYDQRQNGSENIRVHVDGVIVAVFPVETISDALLSAMPDLSDLLDVDDFENFQKPKPPASPSPPKEPIAPSKPEEKPQETPQEQQPALVITQLEADDKPSDVEPLPSKSTETPIDDVSLNSEVVKDKKPMTSAQKKAFRLKKVFANMFGSFVRRYRHH